jgi:prepilin-type N-terminal cleavage/methylation domain-containing protein
MSKQSSFPGFTLIELLVVIAIIGILASIVTTQVQVGRIQARNSSAKTIVVKAAQGVEVYKTANGNLVLAAYPYSAPPASTYFISPMVIVTGLSIARPVYYYIAHTNSQKALSPIFTGTPNSTSYATALPPLPGSGYQLTYIAPNCKNIAPSQSNYGQYSLVTNLQAARSGDAAYFWITNGASSQGGLITQPMQDVVILPEHVFYWDVGLSVVKDPSYVSYPVFACHTY